MSHNSRMLNRMRIGCLDVIGSASKSRIRIWVSWMIVGSKNNDMRYNRMWNQFRSIHICLYIQCKPMGKEVGQRRKNQAYRSRLFIKYVHNFIIWMKRVYFLGNVCNEPMHLCESLILVNILLFWETD